MVFWRDFSVPMVCASSRKLELCTVAISTPMALGGPGGAPPGAGAPAEGAPAEGAPAAGPALAEAEAGGFCMYHHPPPPAITNAIRAMAVFLFDEDMGLRWLMTDDSLSTRLNHAHPLVCERVSALVSRIA